MATLLTLANVFGFAAFGLNVWGNLLLTSKSVLGWYVRIASILCWGVYGVAAASLPNLLNAIVFLGINVYGLRRWTRDEKDRASSC